jgi:hypothetical protein
VTPPWLEPFAARLAALAPLAPAQRLARLDGWARDAAIVTESGRPLRFVATDPSTRAPTAYEARVFACGEVATRVDGPGARHDLLNALVWLAYPRSKARLNALHAHADTAGGAARAGGRGALRDAATLFDENAALWIGTDASLEAALRAFDWRRLFVERRERLAAALRVRVFGHALLEKLDAPFKGITAHAWPLRLPPDTSPGSVDAALAEGLRPDTLSSRALCPLPVMGLPGWCEANRDPAFYNDPAVFRPGRRRALAGARPADRSDRD